ncbi:hypothetical protein FKP32DRAFT_1671482 [Trametes sanguinea]|nr:hypothetical protein FKP32DRAFT_1671482 [Trametes sanguinea]
MPTPTLLTKERAVYPAALPHSRNSSIVMAYDLTVIPRVPLKVGNRARILVLESCDDFFPLATDGRPRYEAKDAGVEGTIVAMKPIGNNLVEFVMRNEEEGSSVSHAYIVTEHAQNLTTELTLCERILVKLATYLTPPTRNVPMELDAIVFNVSHPRPGRRTSRRGPPRASDGPDARREGNRRETRSG